MTIDDEVKALRRIATFHQEEEIYSAPKNPEYYVILSKDTPEIGIKKYRGTITRWDISSLEHVLASAIGGPNAARILAIKLQQRAEAERNEAVEQDT